MNKLILAGLAMGALAVPALAQMAPGDRPAPKAQSRAEVEAKVRARFAALDANRDGFLTRDELRAQVEKKMAERRAAAFDALDTDRNGSISREEFAARGRRGQVMMMRERHGGGRMMMGLMDKDGRVSVDAMVKSALERFDKADANHDGVLTPEERKAAREARRAMWRRQAG